MTQRALEAVAERLRDVRKGVRRDAASHLMAVFRCAFLVLVLMLPGDWRESLLS